jgi:hypothetical protein
VKFNVWIEELVGLTLMELVARSTCRSGSHARFCRSRFGLLSSLPLPLNSMLASAASLVIKHFS